MPFLGGLGGLFGWLPYVIYGGLFVGLAILLGGFTPTPA